MWITRIMLWGLCLLSTCFVFGQVSIDEPSEVRELKERYRQYNSSIETVAGWRIQILATTERRVLDQEKAKFRSKFYDLRFDEKYKKPYYRLTTGASLDKLSILPLLERIKKVYPSSFIVRDPKIEKEELMRIYD